MNSEEEASSTPEVHVNICSGSVVDQPDDSLQEKASSTPEKHADICSASIVDQPDEKLAALPKYMLIYILVIWAKY